LKLIQVYIRWHVKSVILSCLLVVFLAPYRSSAQGSNDFKVVFLKDTLLQVGNSFSFNKVSITNTSSVKQAFGLSLELPANWQTLFDNRKVFQLAPSETLELPLRVAAAYGALSNKLYTISLIMNNAAAGIKMAYHYAAKMQANANWKALVVTPDIKLDHINRETYFQFHVTNTGNIRENFIINFTSGMELTLPNRNNQISVEPGKDTLLKVGIIVDKRDLEAFKPQDISISVTNSVDRTQQTLVQHVFSNNTIFKENPSGWYTAPISIEMVSQNFNSKKQALNYVNSSGYLSLDNHRSLSYYYRSNDFDSQASRTANASPLSNVSSKYENLTYSTSQWKLSAGNQTEFGAFLIDGVGGRVAYKTANDYYGFDAMGVKSRIGNADQFSLKQEINLNKTSDIVNTSLLDFDKKQKQNSLLNITEYDHIFGKKGQLSLIGGYGINDIYQPGASGSRNGTMAGVNYYFNSKSLTIRSLNSTSGRYFPGLEQGVTRSSDEVRFLIGNFFIGSIAEYNDRSLTILDSNKLVSLFSGKTTEYGIRTGFNKGRNSIAITGSVVNQLQDSITSVPFNSNKLSISASLVFFKHLNFTLSGSYSRSLAQNDVNFLKPINSLAAFGTLQNNLDGINFRIDNGPIYYSDLLNYVKNGVRQNRMQVAPYAECYFFKTALDMRLEMDYINDITNAQRSIGPRLDIYLNLLRSGLAVHFYGNRSFGGAGNVNSLNISIRKSFDVPLVGLHKYSSLKVILYKDNNGSNLYDEGDEPIPDASLRIGEQYFTTNNKGEVYYKNIKAGLYTIDLGQVSSLKGWIPKKGYKQQINFDKSQEWYIAYEKSRFLSGKLNVVKDQLSKLEFNPANIRITAISSKGESYTTLTDESGSFFLNLPADAYRVLINTNVFNENFRVLQESMGADINSKMEENVVFEIREKKRTINIRRNKSN
jgi:hypothetical protein